MSATKPPAPRLQLLPALRTGFWRRWRPRGLWRRLLELPWVWVLLLAAAGGAALTPGGLLAPMLSSRIAPGGVAGRDYVASRDLMLYDDGATRAKREQARERELPVIVVRRPPRASTEAVAEVQDAVAWVLARNHAG